MIVIADITSGATCDPVPERTAAWLSRQDRREAMIRHWQELESLFFLKTRWAKSTVDYEDSDLPEACAMRILDKRINAALPAMATEAAYILALPTMSAGGALAKIELGLAVQGSHDWRPSALELVEEGLKDLRDMLGLGQIADAPAHHEVGGF